MQILHVQYEFWEEMGKMGSAEAKIFSREANAT